jgi:hypothetical protein
LLQDLSFLGRQLSVYVVSTGGWSWLLAWAQLGVETIHCIAWNAAAATELGPLCEVGDLCPKIVETSWTEAQQHLSKGAAVFSGHLAWANLDEGTCESVRQALTKVVSQRRCVWLLTAPRSSPGASFIKDGAVMRTAKLRHCALGGLTQARVLVGWDGTADCAGEIHPGRQKNPVQPLGTFLEPSVRLLQWRPVGQNANCWRPNASDAKPYPWPWPTGPSWVETVSVFFPGKAIERPMTPKELCQLADLHKDWGTSWVEAVRRWEGGEAPPTTFACGDRAGGHAVVEGNGKGRFDGGGGHSKNEQNLGLGPGQGPMAREGGSPTLWSNAILWLGMGRSRCSRGSCGMSTG